MPKMRKDKELFRKRNRPKGVDAKCRKNRILQRNASNFPKNT